MLIFYVGEILYSKVHFFSQTSEESVRQSLGKGKVSLCSRPHGPRGRVEVQLYSFMTSALDRRGWSGPRSGLFTPGKDPVPIVQQVGWDPGPVWTCAENLALTGIRSPDRPARSESLYRLSYPGPGQTKNHVKIKPKIQVSLMPPIWMLSSILVHILYVLCKCV